jgi:AGZA family xanthine/uracil permease-like MFS transporter
MNPMSVRMNRMANWLDSYFKVSGRNSTLRTEVKAGLATFFSLSYIFVLGPTLLAGIGLDARHSLIAIVTLSAVATVVAGCLARIPFAFAPGLEMLLYIAFVAIPICGQLPQYAVACVLLSGVVIFALALLKQTHRIHKFPPEQFSDAVAISMSVFLIAQACRIDGLLTYDRGWVHVTHSAGVHWIWGASGGLIALILDAIGVPAPVLISVLLVSILAGKSGLEASGTLIHGSPLAGLKEILELKYSPTQMWPAFTTTISLLVLSLYGSLSKVVNLWQRSHYSKNSELNAGPIPGIDSLMQVEGASAIASGIAGITNVTVFVESGAGIRIGGRTGVASIVTGLSMLSALLLAHDIRYINPVASVGALLYVGILFFPRPSSLKHVSLSEWGIIGVMALIIVGLMSLFWAFAFGLISFVVVREVKNRSIQRKHGTGDAAAR